MTTSQKDTKALNWGRLRKKAAGKARETRGVRRTLAYAAATRDEAQRSIRIFYEVVNNQRSMRCGKLRRLRRAVPLAILLLTCTAVFPLWALQTDFRGGPVTIEADSIAYEGDTDILRAQGKVLIVFTGGVLKADVVTLNRSTNEALAEGNVLLRSYQSVLVRES